MSRNRSTSFWRWVLFVGAAYCGPANLTMACNIPVFRYALENWKPDPYHVFVVSRGALNDSQRATVDRLMASGANVSAPANLEVVTIDVAAQDVAKVMAKEQRGDQVPAWLLEQWKQRLEALPLDEPKMFLLYPHVWDRVAWQAPLTDENAARLIDSPMRQEIGRRLLDGQSAVWVFLESGDAAKDEAAWMQLQQQLEPLSRKIELPARELIEAEKEFRPDVPITLRVEFSALRISKGDQAEQALDAMLRASEVDLTDFGQPIAIPVFGRGRTYYALVGDGIGGDTVEENGRFLCGACSCQVKNENPGVDLLMAVNWDAKIGGSAMPQIRLPELSGVGALDLVATNSAPLGGADRAIAAPAAPATPATSAVGSDPRSSSAANCDAQPVTQVGHPVGDAAPSASVVEPDTRADSTLATPRAGFAPNVNAAPTLSQDDFGNQLTYGILKGIAFAIVVTAVATVFLTRGGRMSSTSQ